MVSLQLTALGFLVTALATRPSPRQESKESIVCALSHHRCLLAFSFLLAFLFLALLTLSLRSFLLPDVHRCRRVKSHVLPTVVVGSLCQCPLPHIRAQGLARLTIREGNHIQEITAGWRLSPHSRHLERLPDCTCGNSVLCKVFLTRSKHFHPSRDLRKTSFSHLARGLRMPLKRAAVRIPPLPSYSSLGHSRNLKAMTSWNQ